MKPYQFFCYTAKYFRLCEKQSQQATEQRAKKIKAIKTILTDEINRVELRLKEKDTATYR